MREIICSGDFPARLLRGKQEKRAGRRTENTAKSLVQIGVGSTSHCDQVKRSDDPNFLESTLPKSASETDDCLVAAILPVNKRNPQRKKVEKRSIEEEVR